MCILFRLFSVFKVYTDSSVKKLCKNYYSFYICQEYGRVIKAETILEVITIGVKGDSAMVLTGLESIKKGLPEYLKGARVGLVCHAASIDNNYNHAIDIFRKLNLKLVAIFGPQHGLYGQTQDNMIEWNGDEEATTGSSIPLYSLYGQNRRPTAAMLENVDIIVVDLQDVGARPYTYIWTIKECLHAAQEFQKEVVVLDRPNPVSFLGLDGAVLKDGFFSFVGGANIPLAHGMTMGEMALFVQREYFRNAVLHVVKMEGWDRSMSFPETGLPWVLPSPNMPTERTAIVYPGMVLFETVNVSEGRGTTTPFEVFGAPWIDVELFEKSLQKHQLDGFVLRRHDFIPTFNKFHSEYCRGFQIHPTNLTSFKPVALPVALMQACYESGGGAFAFTNPPYEYEFEIPPVDIVSGDASLRSWVTSGEPVAALEEVWYDEYKSFRETFNTITLYRGEL